LRNNRLSKSLAMDPQRSKQRTFWIASWGGPV
jgi:hypothetical protein